MYLCHTINILISDTGVLDYRINCSIPATPIAAPAVPSDDNSSSKVDESTEGNDVDDSNPFALIVSEGESSEEEEEGEGESNEHLYTKQQESFIQEAMKRRTTLDQHCT